MNEVIKSNGHTTMLLAQKDGMSKTTSDQIIDIKDRNYFQKALAGNKAVSDPVISRIDGSISIAYAVPIKNNGEVIGVLVAVRDGTNLSQITNDVTFGKSGKTFMINETGVTVAHSNIDLVKKWTIL